MTRDACGMPLVPGYNADRVDVAAGLAMAARSGYGSPEHQMVAQYALMRHARGEEDGAQRSALAGGIDLTSWRMILAAGLAGAAGEEQEGPPAAPDPAPDPLLPAEVAAMFGVDVATVGRWARAGKIPFFTTPGGERRYRRHEVEALLGRPEEGEGNA